MKDNVSVQAQELFNKYKEQLGGLSLKWAVSYLIESCELHDPVDWMEDYDRLSLLKACNAEPKEDPSNYQPMEDRIYSLASYIQSIWWTGDAKLVSQLEKKEYNWENQPPVLKSSIDTAIAIYAYAQTLKYDIDGDLCKGKDILPGLEIKAFTRALTSIVSRYYVRNQSLTSFHKFYGRLVVLDKIENWSSIVLPRWMEYLICNNGQSLYKDIISKDPPILPFQKTHPGVPRTTSVDRLWSSGSVYNPQYHDISASLEALLTSTLLSSEIKPILGALAKKALENKDNLKNVPLSSILNVVKEKEDQKVATTAFGTSVASKPRSSYKPKETHVLTSCGTELTNNNASPISGRSVEIDNAIRILLRQEQSNPIFVGPAGTGKTAIVKHIAYLIDKGKVPPQLEGREIFELSEASVSANTAYRGSAEDRALKIIETAKKRKAILFIDEAHTVFSGSSSSQSAFSIADALKPALASGDISLIAATTTNEFTAMMESDPAIRRRFQRVDIEELSLDVVKTVLKKHTKTQSWEDSYGVKVSSDLLDFIIHASQLYLHDNAQPDSSKKLMIDSCIVAYMAKRKQLERRDILKVLSERTRTSPMYLDRGYNDERLFDFLDRREFLIQRLKSRDRKVPMQYVLSSDDRNQVTNVAEILAQKIYGTKKAVFSIDFKQYRDKTQLNSLFGTAAGYIGFSSEDEFVTPIRRRPETVIVLSNLESATPEIKKRVKSALTEGTVRNARGHVAVLHNATVLLAEPDKANNRIGLSPSGSTKTESNTLDVKAFKFKKKDTSTRLQEALKSVYPGFDVTAEDIKEALSLKTGDSVSPEEAVIDYILNKNK